MWLRETKTCAGVAELVDAVALGATVLWTCRFESCPRHQSLPDCQHGSCAEFAGVLRPPEFRIDE
jgi:hypothetical protein